MFAVYALGAALAILVILGVQKLAYIITDGVQQRKIDARNAAAIARR